MIAEQLSIGLVLERRHLTGPWGGYVWRPYVVFTVAPEVAPWNYLGGNATVARYYAGEAILHLYSTDTANYRDNLASGAPKLWVVLRPSGPEPPVEVALVTADPTEGEAATEIGENIVETIDMPAEIAAHFVAFVMAHHVERSFHKRKRDRSMPGSERPGGNRPDGEKPGEDKPGEDKPEGG